jgi:hypothetical protein
VSEEEHRGEFRAKKLFREKKPEEIQELKLRAKNIMRKGELIGTPQENEGAMELELENVVQELVEYIHLHKKKACHKDK